MPEKYKRELEEILDKMNGGPSSMPLIDSDGDPKMSRNFSNPLHNFFNDWRHKITPGRMAILAIMLILVWLLLNGTTSFELSPLVWLAIMLLVAAYIRMFTRQKNTYQKKWRGRVIDEPKRSLYTRIKNLYSRR